MVHVTEGPTGVFGVLQFAQLGDSEEEGEQREVGHATSRHVYFRQRFRLSSPVQVQSKFRKQCRVFKCMWFLCRIIIL